VGAGITQSGPKPRRAWSQIVLATSITTSHMFPWLKSSSCIFMSTTVSLAREAVGYTTPRP
jgi:Na+/H+ antiporter NhaC